MSFDEAMEATVSRAEARREIEKHDGAEWALFLLDCGDFDEYPGRTVLRWLGY